MKYIISCVVAGLLSLYTRAQNAIIRINQVAPTANEVCISIHPDDTRYMVAGTNINLLYSSNDSGKTWVEKRMHSSLGIWGDPVLLYDDSGYVYYAHLSRTHRKEFPETIDRIVVQRSTDNGLTFNDGIGVGKNNSKAQDKEWMSFDANVKSPYYGNLYLSWTEFDQYGSKKPEHQSRIRFARSVNRALSFHTPVVVSDSAGDCVDGDNTTEGATSTVTPDGTVLVAWSAFGKIFLDISSDGGLTFGQDRIIAEQVKGWDMQIKHVYRSNGMPFLASDQCITSPNFGRVYLCWADERMGDADVWLIYSDNKGASWSSPIRVNSDITANGKSQFMPHICVDQSTGNVFIIYYDTRHSKEAFMDTYVAVSENGGTQFKDMRLTHATPMAGKKIFFGDYITIAASKGVVRAAWTSTGKNGPEVRVTAVDGFDSNQLLTPYISLPFFDSFEDKLHVHVSTGRKAQGLIQLIVNGNAQSPVEVAEEDELILTTPESGKYTIRLLSYSRQLLAEESFTVER